MPRLPLDEDMVFYCPKCNRATANNNKVLGNYCSQECYDRDNDGDDWQEGESEESDENDEPV